MWMGGGVCDVCGMWYVVCGMWYVVCGMCQGGGCDVCVGGRGGEEGSQLGTHREGKRPGVRRYLNLNLFSVLELRVVVARASSLFPVLLDDLHHLQVGQQTVVRRHYLHPCTAVSPLPVYAQMVSLGIDLDLQCLEVAATLASPHSWHSLSHHITSKQSQSEARASFIPKSPCRPGPWMF
jgi:hypothetical protein